MELLKLLSANEIVAQAVCFLLLVAFLRVFVWKRFLKILDDRHERIASEFRDIENAKAAVEKLRIAYDERLAGIEEEARAKIRDAIIDGKMAAEEVRQKAQADAQIFFEKTRENIKIEIARAEEKLKNKIVDLTIEVAEKVIGERLSEAGDRKLVEKFINELKPK
ncbi:MAG: F0F1 ATP synthase subunit B [Candidatus Omnitrophota bacterium]|nr:F0F1 ATP synthase subunit B [Candidatus Omnitrophota bacterium]